MATKKTAVIPKEEILAAATDENINEHALHQTETEPEPDRVLSAEGAPGDADLIDIWTPGEQRSISQTDQARRPRPQPVLTRDFKPNGKLRRMHQPKTTSASKPHSTAYLR